MVFYNKMLFRFEIVFLFLMSVAYSGTLLDNRDGKNYLTVKIGDLEWMAENLNYESEYSECYEDSPGNCEIFGRLYIWSEAKNVCPDGWHLPSENEFRSLATVATYSDVLGKELKSASRWDGSNELEFNAVPGGYCYYSAEEDSLFCRGEGNLALFWSAERIGQDSTYRMHLEGKMSEAIWAKMPWVLYEEREPSLFYYLSVRCVKNKTKYREYEPRSVVSKVVNTVIKCNDGTFSKSQTCQGACSHHGGVEDCEYPVDESYDVAEKFESSANYRDEYASENNTVILCKDGTISNSQSRKGTCSGHGGVEDWEYSTKKQNAKQSDWVDDVIKVGEFLLKGIGAALEVYNAVYSQSTSSRIRCKDGTFSDSQSRNGTCSHHGGVEDWDN